MDIFKLSLFNYLFKVAEDTDRKRQEELRQLQEHHQVDLIIICIKLSFTF